MAELFITVAVLLALGHSRLVLVIAFHVGTGPKDATHLTLPPMAASYDVW